MLFPHAKLAAEQQPESLDVLEDWASLQYKAAWYAWRKGSLADAEKLAVQSMEIRKKLFGQKHKDTLSSMQMAGSVYRDQGRWNEAEKLEVQVMETRKRVLGQEHPSTLTSMANLAFTWKSQSRNCEALKLMKKCFQLQQQKLGENHPDTVSSRNTLKKWEQDGSSVLINLAEVGV
ncbi:hypothetical protein F5884DRAFT_535147 [Xylogone sp. PMI_703]|nr:hypothetical protein F5884DRAFT_535147 [Xylogone sp. PMI_703]